MNTLALKYRPRVLADLVGQEASVKALSNALRRAQTSGRIHHQAFLFAGVRGTGKTSSARILARSLNCVHGPTPEPCGVCDPCRASEQPDLNLDVIEIDAASRASVEDARALREQVQTRPAFCLYRVYIIDEVHMLSRSAFDALLKILEEPPPHAVFVLATTELQDVPDTIKSRVQIYPFRLIPVGLIQGRLESVCRAEGVTWDEGALRLVAEAGQGSMRDALTTLDRVIAAGDGHVREDLVREQLGIVPAIQVQRTLEAVLAGDAGAVLDQCAALASLGTDWVSFWKEFILGFRDHLEREARKGGPHETLRLARMLHLLLQRERDLRDTSLPQVVVELALVTAANLPHLAPLDALVRGGTSGSTPSSPPARRPEAGTAPRAAVPPAASPASPAPSPLSEAELRQRCGEALKALQHTVSRTLPSLPHLASRVALEGHTLRLTYSDRVRHSVEELEREQDNPQLLAALRTVVPDLRKVAITFESALSERPEDRLKEDPVFQRLIRTVGGEITQVTQDS